MTAVDNESLWNCLHGVPAPNAYASSRDSWTEDEFETYV